MRTRLTSALFASVLCLSLTAAAQGFIDFNGLPHTGAPLPIPSGYAGMNWNNFDYVTFRFTNGLQNVAFPAFGTGAQTMAAVDLRQPFQLVGMTVTGDYNTTLTLYAYNVGVFAGSQSYHLAPSLTALRVPAQWGSTTQVTFVCRDAQQKPASFNLYNLTFQ